MVKNKVVLKERDIITKILSYLILIHLTTKISIISEEKQIWRTVCTKPMIK